MIERWHKSQVSAKALKYLHFPVHKGMCRATCACVTCLNMVDIHALQENVNAQTNSRFAQADLTSPAAAASNQHALRTSLSKQRASQFRLEVDRAGTSRNPRAKYAFAG